MLDIEFLHALRAHELHQVAVHLRPGSRVLELGGGTGLQARELARRGFDVASVDVESSTYRDLQVFPVTTYDGTSLPFAANSFDAVFSSSVLEHLTDLESMHAEVRRVLRPGGICVHVLPTATWRFWSSLAHYPELTQRVLRALPDFQLAAHLLLRHLRPPRHGETGTAWTELRTFSRRHWIAHFRTNGFTVVSAEPMHLFYTGSTVLGPHWSLDSRRRASHFLGSACALYRLAVA